MNLSKVHEDVRGTISVLKGLEKTEEVTIFTTEAEYARGGCIHKKSNEYSCVVEGMVRYVIGDRECIKLAGEGVTIPKNTPHYFVALTDCVVLEWGASLAEKQKKHPAFRKIVDTINQEKG